MICRIKKFSFVLCESWKLHILFILGDSGQWLVWHKFRGGMAERVRSMACYRFCRQFLNEEGKGRKAENAAETDERRMELGAI